MIGHDQHACPLASFVNATVYGLEDSDVSQNLNPSLKLGGYQNILANTRTALY